MKTPLFYLMLSLILLTVSSCDKVIDVRLDNDSDKLVIEGNITNVSGTQTIKLNTNVAFSNTNTYPSVTGAQVKVNDQYGNVYAFQEGSPGIYTIPKMAGITGGVYKLSVTTKGKTYEASSKIPVQVALDNVRAFKDNFSTDENKKKITVYYTDPKGLGNQYNFLLYVNDVQVKRVFANNDDFTDGNKVAFDLAQDDISIYAGDKVTVEMQSVDKTMYTYWYTLMQQGFKGPIGGVTPSNPPNNITPEVLGYFSAHTIQTKTITVK
ncbi:DUF4249 domain-containing protein [Mucilaginibacter sp. NFX135]|uniref:DUF4249 domain-containing protein n=1 Tax=Mucilaginibacter sp. NFX135 TaxID=3402687 RepID=UPI003AFA9E1B